MAIQFIPMAIGAAVRVGGQQGLKIAGREFAKEGAGKALKEGAEKALLKSIDDLADALLKNKGKKVLGEILEKIFTNGGGAFLRKGMNLLDKGLGDKVEDALSALFKTGKMADLSHDQVKVLAQGLVKISTLVI